MIERQFTGPERQRLARICFVAAGAFALVAVVLGIARGAPRTAMAAATATLSIAAVGWQLTRDAAP